MKTLLIVVTALLAAVSLAATAQADVIASPAAVAGLYAVQFLPWILVGAAVGVTVYLLKKFWKKKK